MLEPAQSRDSIGRQGDVAIDRSWIARPVRSFRVPSSLNSYQLPLMLAACVPFALLIDCQVSAWFTSHSFPGDLRRLLRAGEMYAHGTGVVFVVATIYLLDKAKRWLIPTVMLSAFGAGLVANVIKLMVARTRPRHFDFGGNVWATFDGWLPLISRGSAGQSFPSAHVAVAAGLTVVLSRLYPQGRMLFTTLAVLAASQRVQSGSHYLSDVLIGGVIGIVFARGIAKMKIIQRHEANRSSDAVGASSGATVSR